jgi:hypothetical protein
MPVDHHGPAKPDTGARAAALSRRWRRLARHALIALGWVCVGLGVIGLAVPGMPTTVFLIVALWAFSRSSERFHRWLYEHPRLGPPLKAWHTHGVIALRAKLLAVTVMASSLVIIAAVSDSALGPLVLGVILVPIAVFIVTRPSRVPDRATGN